LLPREAVPGIAQRLEHGSPPAGAPPEPPPSSVCYTGTFSSSSCSPSSSTLGEKPSQLISFSSRTSPSHARPRRSSRAAPSGAGRRRGMGDPLDSPVTCAYASATRRAHPRTFWSTTARSRAAPASPPPRAAALWCARRRPLLVCVQSPWILRGRLRSHTPSRLRGGPPWTREPSSRHGPRRTRAPAAVGSKIHGAALAILLKSPSVNLF
jgi:hypothetical protein